MCHGSPGLRLPRSFAPKHSEGSASDDLAPLATRVQLTAEAPPQDPVGPNHPKHPVEFLASAVLPPCAERGTAGAWFLSSKHVRALKNATKDTKQG